MATRTELRQDAFKLAVSILQTAKDPEHLLKHNKYFEITLKSDLHKKYFKKLLKHPQIQPLVEERYAVPWPTLDDMSAMPKGSLGFCMQKRFNQLAIDPLPAMNQSREKILKSSPDEEYLDSRQAITHDIYHLVLGLPITAAGEAAFAAYFMISNQEPALVAGLAMWMTHSFINPTESRIIWEGINFGIQLGLAGVFLQGCRWEEGWERSLEEWRAELGLLPLLNDSPFQDELHRYESANY